MWFNLIWFKFNINSEVNQTKFCDSVGISSVNIKLLKHFVQKKCETFHGEYYQTERHVVNYLCMIVVTFIISTFFHIYKLHNLIVKNYNTNLFSCFININTLQVKYNQTIKESSRAILMHVYVCP